MNHRAMVFGTKVSCPVCGAPRPENAYGASESVWPEQAWTQPSRNSKVSSNAKSGGTISYGSTDNLSKLIRDSEPMPYFVPMPDPLQEENVIGGADWICKCGEPNFRGRRICRKCFKERTDEVSAQLSWEDLCKAYKTDRKSRSRSRSRSRSKRKKKRKRRRSSSSSSSSTSNSEQAKRRRHANKQASSVPVEVDEVEDTTTNPVEEKNPAVEKAKSEALQKVVKLREADIPVDEKRRQWRALLREWHPDKHADNVEVATAVFQFLQKAKTILKLEG